MSKLDLAIFMGYPHDPQHPSVRLRRLNLRKPLRKVGVNADIICRFEDLAPFKNVLFSHYNQEVVQQIRQRKSQGKRIFYCHSENLWGYPYQEEAFNLCDYIVCCSTKLAELTQARLTSQYTCCVVVPDMVEEPTPNHLPVDRDNRLVVWTGMGGNSYLARELAPTIESLGMELVIISEHADADIKWERDTYLKLMAECDIAICPQNVALQPAKSSVKVVTAMGVGLPLVCSPNPAYKEIVNSGVNGYVADTPEEWKAALTQLADYKRRVSVSKAALETAKNFTPKAIAEHWVRLLSPNPVHHPKVALINNTLSVKYLSYGDILLEGMRTNGIDVDEYRYEDIDCLPNGYDMYIFVEVRYSPEDISDVFPKVLYTKENPNLNFLPHFDCIVSPNQHSVDYWLQRGFVNVMRLPEGVDRELYNQIKAFSKYDWIEHRKKHNKQLHSDHIDMFHSLQPPEARWDGGSRDKIHIKYTDEKAELLGDKLDILDVGSADGWLALYLAKKGHNVSGLEFVSRGMDWTKSNATRLGVEIDLRYGYAEDTDTVFSDKQFDLILAYEILEHLDYQKIPWYLDKFDKCLKPGGKVLVSLPNQDLIVNPEHLWSPSKKLIDKVFLNKFELVIEWIDIPNHEIPGNWFISYSKSE